MKLITQNYGCGTSSSILDYGIQDVVVVSETNYEHVFDVEDDLLFIGHDFLLFLWDTDEKLQRWMQRKDKWEHWVWCFERIDAIVPQWMQKSHFSLHQASKFCKRILACDEDDCDKYRFDWLPQWASCRFYDRRATPITSDRILFSGQAGGPEYNTRNLLLRGILDDSELSHVIEITNTRRSLDWDGYIENLLSHRMVLNPVGILRGLNTRAYEALYSGRLLLQHTDGYYPRHEKMLNDYHGVRFFRDIEGLREAVKSAEIIEDQCSLSYTNHSLYARMKSVGVEIK